MEIDITDHSHIKIVLQELEPCTSPLWGNMNAQQMVEHLIEQVQYTNGKKTATCSRSAEEAAQRKQQMLSGETEIPKNFFLGDPPLHFNYPDLIAAIEQLIRELDDFDSYFTIPDQTAIHGGFGPMNYKEWITWHNKHFTHHFIQFALLAAEI